jgi:mannose-6-phosphate isomerase-like protein (cupin superfamily)
MPMRVITDRIGVSELFVDETLPDADHPLYFHHRTVAPGGRAHAAHTHGPDAEQVECFFVIEGEAEVQIEDRRHGFRNAGDGPLRYLVMTAPGPPPANAIGRAPAPGESGRG